MLRLVSSTQNWRKKRKGAPVLAFGSPVDLSKQLEKRALIFTPTARASRVCYKMLAANVKRKTRSMRRDARVRYFVRRQTQFGIATKSTIHSCFAHAPMILQYFFVPLFRFSCLTNAPPYIYASNTEEISLDFTIHLRKIQSLKTALVAFVLINTCSFVRLFIYTGSLILRLIERLVTLIYPFRSRVVVQHSNTVSSGNQNCPIRNWSYLQLKARVLIGPCQVLFF